MLRQTFERKQRRLRDEVLVLGSHVEEAIAISIEALEQRDIGQAMQLIADGRDINRKCAAIETDTLSLFATQQPMAGDLRFLATILEIALELERIADHAKEIAVINFKLGQDNLPGSFSGIAKMADEAGDMLRRALEAFAKLDLALARAVPCQDDKVDDLYHHVYRELLAIIKTDSNTVKQAVYLSQVAHHLERVADRTTNICEWVVFAITGEMKELNGDDR